MGERAPVVSKTQSFLFRDEEDGEDIDDEDGVDDDDDGDDGCVSESTLSPMGSPCCASSCDVKYAVRLSVSVFNGHPRAAIA